MPGLAPCTMRLAAVRRETGAWHKAMPPPTPRYRGTQLHAQAVLFLHLRVSLSRLGGPDGVTPVPFPSVCGGPVASLSSLLPRTRVYSGSHGRLGSGTASALRGVKAYVRLSPLPWSPLSVPSYPPRCGGGLVHPPSPTTTSAHHCRGMHCTCCTMCMPAPAPCVAWVRAVCAL